MKTITALLVVLGFLVPVLAEAKSAPAPKDKTAPTATYIHISSSGTNPAVAKAGDTVVLSFTASEKVTPIVLVETKTLFVKAKNSSGNSWDASYVVNAKDPKGKVDYLLTLLDSAGNVTICSSIKLPIIKYCPTTDGSSVTVSKDATPPPVVDTTAPVIAPHAAVVATTTGTSAQVAYALPLATDDRDGSVAVSCAPASGSTFAVGSTTVNCSAHDAAGNAAASSFAVVVTQEVVPPHEPVVYTMKQQADESYLCGETTGTWQICDQTATFGFTQDFGSVATIDLGLGSSLGAGTLHSVTIANTPQDIFHPWLVTIACYNDADYTQACSGWSSPSQRASQSTDSVHWTANFGDSTTLSADNYYQLVIDHTTDGTEWPAPAYGSLELLQPYFVLKGITQ